MTWVFEHSESRLAARLVLLALAEYAHDDGGMAFPSVTTLATKARVSERKAREALRELERDGGIEPMGRTRKGTIIYRVLMRTPEESAGGQNLPGAESDSVGGQNPTARGANFAPEPSIEPTTEEPTTNIEGTLFSSPSNVVKFPRPDDLISPKTVDRRKVTLSEFVLADKVLTEWNRQTGQNKRADGYRAKIIMRIREHPETTFEQHAEIIQRNLAAPWWKGEADPAVIYGKDEQFERAMQCDGKPRTKQAANARIRDVLARVERGEVG